MDAETLAYPYPGKSTILLSEETAKKLIICVRPGVLLVFAKFRFPVKVLIALDLPAFERPQKTTSDPASIGHSDNLVALVKNCTDLKFEDIFSSKSI